MKIACNGKRSLDSASESLRKLSVLWKHFGMGAILYGYCRFFTFPIASAIIAVASLKIQNRKNYEIVDLPI